MQNPFTTTFSKPTEYTYVATEQPNEILENFSYDHPTESVYKITGVRGSGKTVILAKVEEELRKKDGSFLTSIRQAIPCNKLLQCYQMLDIPKTKKRIRALVYLHLSWEQEVDLATAPLKPMIHTSM